MPFVTDITQYWVGILAHRLFEYPTIYLNVPIAYSEGYKV